MKKHVTLLLAAALLGGCQETDRPGTEAPAAVDLTKELPGAWEIVGIKVDIQSFENRDTAFVFEIREESWEREYRVKPARTYFQTDNRYHRVFRTLNDDTLGVSRGMWNVFGDSLMLVEPDTSYQFQVSIAKGMAEYRRLVDWDGDGQADDDYREYYRRISRSAE